MTKLTALTDIFDIEYGNQFDKNKLVLSNDGINLVSRTSVNLGVDCRVKLVEGYAPYDAGLITATMGGTYLLSAFVQQKKFYTAQNIKVLRPKIAMTFNEKFFIALLLQKIGFGTRLMAVRRTRLLTKSAFRRSNACRHG